MTIAKQKDKQTETQLSGVPAKVEFPIVFGH
jgi:hypothetical protein